MVTCKLYGGLGNQLFMMAATIGYASRFNMEYRIPKLVENPHYPNQQPYIFPGVVYTDTPLDLPLYKEPAYHFQEIPKMDNLCLDGYFQTEKYFSNCRPRILQAFGFPYEMNKGVVAIHVRRGDYLRLPDYHPSVTLEYITNGIHQFLMAGYTRFKVFSDDIAWCKQAIGGHYTAGTPSFEYSEGKSEIQDLTEASQCMHIIGSNSTFSWWAHYLNQYEQKHAIFPKTWFGRFLATHDTKDLYPAGCTRL
jgi:hypothetical protein